MPNWTTSEALRRTWIEDAIVLGLLVSGLLVSAVLFAGPSQVTASDIAPAEVEVAEQTPPPLRPTLDHPPLEDTPDTDIPDPAPVIMPEPEVAEPTPLGSNETPIPEDQLLETGSAFITLFGDGAVKRRWYQADRPTPNGFWLNDFRPKNISASSEGLSLSITKKDEESDRPWTAGELSTRQVYGYGRYETIMKPAKGSGLVSSFFTYTGPYFGNPQDEIDIEFLGKDPRKVEFNMFRKGRAYASLTYDLDFDATEDFHLYAFEWRPDGVTWFVNDKAVHHASAEDYPIPATSGFLMMNIWTGKMSGWHGRANFTSGASADYACVSYRPIASKARRCADIYVPPQSLAPKPNKTIAGKLADLMQSMAAASDRPARTAQDQ
ncbi:MAG: hypothetical protein Hens3KO_16710 [Henriciella sp.]